MADQQIEYDPNPRAFLDFLSGTPGRALDFPFVAADPLGLSVMGAKKGLEQLLALGRRDSATGKHGDGWEYGPPEEGRKKLTLDEILAQLRGGALGGGSASYSRSGGGGVGISAGQLEKPKTKGYDDALADIMKFRALLEGTPLPVAEQFSELKAIEERLAPLMGKRPKMENQSLSDSKLSNAAINFGLSLLAKKGLGNSALAAKAGFDADRAREQAQAMEGWKGDVSMADRMIGAQGRDVAGRNAGQMQRYGAEMARGSALAGVGKDTANVTHLGNTEEIQRVNNANDNMLKLQQLRLQAAGQAEAAAARRDANDPLKQFHNQAAAAGLYAKARAMGDPNAVAALDAIFKVKPEKATFNDKQYETFYTQLTQQYAKKGSPEMVDRAARSVAAGIAGGKLDPSLADDYITTLLKQYQGN